VVKIKRYKMFFSKWTLFQGAALLGMIALVFIAEFFSLQISSLLSSGPYLSFLIILTFILIGSSLISLFLIFHSKKSDRFLSHPLWEKMNILLAFLFILSILVFISAFIFTPLSDALLTHRWVLYLIVFYFLFLLNLFVLSIIHKAKKDLSKEKKIELSFIWTVLSTVILIFLIPSI
jgi:hypothetical protein